MLEKIGRGIAQEQ